MNGLDEDPKKKDNNGKSRVIVTGAGAKGSIYRTDKGYVYTPSMKVAINMKKATKTSSDDKKPVNHVIAGFPGKNLIKSVRDDDFFNSFSRYDRQGREKNTKFIDELRENIQIGMESRYFQESLEDLIKEYEGKLFQKDFIPSDRRAFRFVHNGNPVMLDDIRILLDLYVFVRYGMRGLVYSDLSIDEQVLRGIVTAARRFSMNGTSFRELVADGLIPGCELSGLQIKRNSDNFFTGKNETHVLSGLDREKHIAIFTRAGLDVKWKKNSNVLEFDESTADLGERRLLLNSFRFSPHADKTRIGLLGDIIEDHVLSYGSVNTRTFICSAGRYKDYPYHFENEEGAKIGSFMPESLFRSIYSFSEADNNYNKVVFPHLENDDEKRLRGYLSVILLMMIGSTNFSTEGEDKMADLADKKRVMDELQVLTGLRLHLEELGYGYVDVVTHARSLSPKYVALEKFKRREVVEDPEKSAMLGRLMYKIYYDVLNIDKGLTMHYMDMWKFNSKYTFGHGNYSYRTVIKNELERALFFIHQGVNMLSQDYYFDIRKHVWKMIDELELTSINEQDGDVQALLTDLVINLLYDKVFTRIYAIHPGKTYKMPGCAILPAYLISKQHGQDTDVFTDKFSIIAVNYGEQGRKYLDMLSVLIEDADVTYEGNSYAYYLARSAGANAHIVSEMVASAWPLSSRNFTARNKSIL